MPATECLADVVVRLLPYWHDAIAPDLLAGRTVLVAAHGNSLRALIKHLDGITDADIAELEIPTGVRSSTSSTPACRSPADGSSAIRMPSPPPPRPSAGRATASRRRRRARGPGRAGRWWVLAFGGPGALRRYFGTFYSL